MPDPAALPDPAAASPAAEDVAARSATTTTITTTAAVGDAVGSIQNRGGNGANDLMMTLLAAAREVVASSSGKATAGAVGGGDASSGTDNNDDNDSRWESNVAALARYRRQHGHCKVPSSYPPNRRLAQFVKKVRTHRRYFDEGPACRYRTCLTPDKIRELDRMGFTWNVRKKRPFGGPKAAWMGHYRDVVEYKARHGNALVPKRYPPNPTLGIWTHNQRLKYKQRLKAESEIASENTPSSTAAAAIRGRTNGTDPLSPRTALLEKLMPQWRIDKLNEIEFQWYPKDLDASQEWYERLDELKSFRRQNGHCNVPRRFAANPGLGAWVRTQRYNYQIMMKAKQQQQQRSSPTVASTIEADGDGNEKQRNCHMTEHRKQLLDDIGFQWSVSTSPTRGPAGNDNQNGPANAMSADENAPSFSRKSPI